jgi:DNA repair protein RAD50
MAGSSEVYQRMLKLGKEKAICTACNRRMDDHELAVFEKHASLVDG